MSFGISPPDTGKPMNETEHLLTCLLEECSEVIKDCSKSLRFGLDDRNVLDPSGPTNRERIVAELNDLVAVVELLEERGHLQIWESDGLKEAKKQKVLSFMEYA